jgi:sec-independent protein translocase protein TatA
VGDIGLPELLVIFGIALLIFGPRKIGELGKGLGEGIRGFKSAITGEPKKDPGKESPPAEQESGEELKANEEQKSGEEH